MVQTMFVTEREIKTIVHHKTKAIFFLIKGNQMEHLQCKEEFYIFNKGNHI